MAEAWPETEQERQLKRLFLDLEKALKKLDKIKDPTKIDARLRNITATLKAAKVLIKEFEREARTDGMPAFELADRRRALVASLNQFIEAKRAYGQKDENRAELMGEQPTQEEQDVRGMNMRQLVVKGHKGMDDIDKTLRRAEETVNKTEAVGIETAGEMVKQTEKLEKVVDGLNEIEFNMKKATKVIGDISRSMMTDKCIMFLMVLVAAGVTALIIIKIVKPNKQALTDVVTNNTLYNQTASRLYEQYLAGMGVANQAYNSTVGQIPTGQINIRRRRLLFADPQVPLLLGHSQQGTHGDAEDTDKTTSADAASSRHVEWGMNRSLLIMELRTRRYRRLLDRRRGRHRDRMLSGR